MASYGQFCPVSKATEVLSPRWALLVVREMLCGSRTFGDIHRGVPGCPPATLSKRLKELELAGVLVRSGPRGASVYTLTAAGLELYPIVESLGHWGQRWARSRYGPDELDADMLLWDVRRFLDPSGLGVQPVVIELVVEGPRARPRYWIVVDDECVDLCLIDPRRPVDAVITADLRALTKVWMGDTDFRSALDGGTIALAGPEGLCRRIPDWFGQHPVLAATAEARASAT